jgi:hypothetical protein
MSKSPSKFGKNTIPEQKKFESSVTGKQRLPTEVISLILDYGTTSSVNRIQLKMHSFKLI